MDAAGVGGADVFGRYPIQGRATVESECAAGQHDVSTSAGSPRSAHQVGATEQARHGDSVPKKPLSDWHTSGRQPA